MVFYRALKFIILLIVLFFSVKTTFSQRGVIGGVIPNVLLTPTISHLKCFSESGSVDYLISISTGWNKKTKVNELNLLNSLGEVVYTHEGFGSTGSVTGLAVGQYTFVGSITVTSSSGFLVSVLMNRTIWIGKETSWREFNEMAIGVNSYSATRNANIQTHGGVRSFNSIPSGDGWIEMSADYGGSTNSHIYWVVGQINDLTSFNPFGGSSQYIEFYSSSSSSGIRVKYLSLGVMYSSSLSLNKEDKIRLVRAGSSLTIQVNDSDLTIFTFPDTYLGPLNVGVFTKEVNDGCSNVISSFPCEGMCRPLSYYPNPITQFPIEGVYIDGDINNPLPLCLENTRIYSVSTISDFAKWSTTNGSLSCNECSTTTFTAGGNDATISVALYADAESMINNSIPCITYTFNVPVCPVTPCVFGDIVSSNGTNPVEYSSCDIPQITVSGSSFYSWSPQVGLTCYDCPNPELLPSAINNNLIPPSYEVKAYSSLIDRDYDRFCAVTTINMLKKYCADDCIFQVTTSPSDLTSLCPGDIVVLTVSGEGSYTWTADNSGLNCENCAQTFFTVQDVPVNVSLDVSNAASQLCGEFDVEISSSINCMDIIGISYNNYGVNTYIEMDADSVYLNVYGNILNEQVVNSSATLDYGTFINHSGIAVEKDWINNALNDFFVTTASFGNELLIGSFQRIRGLSPTWFYKLYLKGQGKKELFVDAYSLFSVDLSINELSTRDNIMFIENDNPSAMNRLSGFVSSNLTGGALSRKMSSAYTIRYLFPLGSTLGSIRYRPIEVKHSNNDYVKARLVNYNPAYDNLIELASDVSSVNDIYYHEIQSSTNSVSNIRFHYVDVLDGQYQHIAQFESQNPPIPYWQKTGAITISNSTFSPNDKSIETVWNYFDTPPFALANAGFVIDWGDFGNPTDPSAPGEADDSGVTVTVTNDTAPGGGGGTDENQDIGGSTSSGGTDPSVYTPSPVAGNYTITIDGGTCAQSGEILFEVDGAGDIVVNSIFFNNGTVMAPLALTLYSLGSTGPMSSGTSIFDINSTPSEQFAQCTEDVVVSLTNGIQLSPGDNIVVTAPADFTVNTISVYDQNMNVVTPLSTSSNTWNSSGSISSGMYKYEVALNYTNPTTSVVESITLRGQFIIN